jgi:hypothetical protein
MKRPTLVAAILAAQITWSPLAHAEKWEALRMFTGLDYSAGKYGEATDTEILYVPVSVKYETGPWAFRATTSYIHMHGPANVVGGGEAGALVANFARAADVSRSGPGDIFLGATYSLDHLWRKGLFIDFTGKVKLPTASAAKGLGTGKTDFTAQIDVAKTWGRFTPFATLAYRFIGTPSAYPLHDAWNGSLGLQYTVSHVVSTGLSFDYRQSASPTGTDPRELFGYVAVAVTPKWSLEFYGIAGLSDGSPDAGGGLQITFRSR